MRINREMQIAGIPAIPLRDALKRIGDGTWPANSLGTRLKLAGEDAVALCDELVSLGYLSTEHWHGTQLYSLTTRGKALTLASAAKPITRRKAEALVSAVIERAHSINANAGFVFGVKQILAFGSFVGSAAELGDVDLAVELYPKHQDPQSQQLAAQRYAQEAQEAGRRFRSVFDMIVAPQLDVFSALKGKSKYLSIHDAGELRELPGTTTKLIFTAPLPP